MSSKISKEDLAELKSIFRYAQGDNLGRDHIELSRLIIPLTNAFPALIAEVEEARDLIQEVDHVYDWLLREAQRAAAETANSAGETELQSGPNNTSRRLNHQ